MAARRLLARQLQLVVNQAGVKTPTTLRKFASSVEPAFLVPAEASSQQVHSIQINNYELEHTSIPVGILRSKGMKTCCQAIWLYRLR